MKDQKNEFLLWVGILGMVGLFVYFMPNIERLIFGRATKEKTVEVKEEVKEVKSGKVTCGASLSDNTSLEYIAYYEDSKIIKLVTTTTSIYTEKNDEYNKVLKTCNNSINYNDEAGYESVCKASELKIVQEETFDLKSFKEFTITNEDDSTSVISLSIKYNEDIDVVVDYLESLKTTCK